MYNLNSFSLETLIQICRQAALIDECRMTDWVVVLKMDSEELVMNHANAHVFLQGLIRGSFQRQKLTDAALYSRLDSIPLPRSKKERRCLVG